MGEELILLSHRPVGWPSRRIPLASTWRQTLDSQWRLMDVTQQVTNFYLHTVKCTINIITSLRAREHIGFITNHETVIYPFSRADEEVLNGWSDIFLMFFLQRSFYRTHIEARSGVCVETLTVNERMTWWSQMVPRPRMFKSLEIAGEWQRASDHRMDVRMRNRILSPLSFLCKVASRS